jgi:hypothetical protein
MEESMLGPRTTLALAGTAVGIAALLGASSAHASTGAGTVVGHGTISPGLTNTPTYQSVSFTGTLAAVGQPAKGTGTYSCSFTGRSNIKEDLNKGKGNASGTCSGSKGTTRSTVAYKRTGSVVTLSGTATGVIAGAITGVCDFAPTSAPQVKTYQLQCELVIK